uniref:Uncharacterized protein n=1 Tax=Panagrolaimus sp. ES5 TaxID=591445 RepID=A0AC34FKB6_9BILA
MNEDGTIVPLEKLVKHLPKLKEITIDVYSDSCITANTVKELCKLPHFTKLIKFELRPITEIFDIDTFYKYFKVTFFKLETYNLKVFEDESKTAIL